MRETRLRLPALLLGLAFVIVFCALTPYNNVRLQNTPLAGGHFPLASIAALLLLVVVVNPLLGLVRRSWRFHFHELLLIWSMVTVATGIAYTGLMRTFLLNVTTPAWFQSSGSALAQVLRPLLSERLFPADPRVVHELYAGIEGGADLGWREVLLRIPWQVWIAPMLWWGLFIALVFATMLGLAGIFSHQWIANEKMNFPLLRVPQVLSEASEKGELKSFLTHRYFIFGMSIPVLLHLFNGLATYYPQIPQIPTLVLAQPYIPATGLLSGFAKVKIYFYPAFIGFAYLTSTQVSFSLWFFFILGGFLPGVLELFGWRLPAAALGTTFGPVVSRVEEMQMIGAFGVFFVFIVWLARDHLRLVLRMTFLGERSQEEFQGLLGPRAAAILLFGGSTGTALWLTCFGMDWLSTVLFLTVAFGVQLVAARLICQGGLPYFTLTAAPSDGFLAFLDSRLIAPVTLALGLVVQKVSFVDLRESLLPSLFHASKLSEGSRSRGRFLAGIALAIGFGLVVSFVAMLALCYKYGINTLPDDWAVETTRRVHENIAQLISHPEEAKPWSMTFSLVGAAVMTLLVFGYHQFIWWPLHPIGYLTTYSSAMQILWFSFFIGWLSNALVLRYGGAALFKEVRRLFIGLVVGDMVMACFWLIVGWFTSISYHVLPL